MSSRPPEIRPARGDFPRHKEQPSPKPQLGPEHEQPGGGGVGAGSVPAQRPVESAQVILRSDDPQSDRQSHGGDWQVRQPLCGSKPCAVTVVDADVYVQPATASIRVRRQPDRRLRSPRVLGVAGHTQRAAAQCSSLPCHRMLRLSSSLRDQDHDNSTNHSRRRQGGGCVRDDRVACPERQRPGRPWDACAGCPGGAPTGVPGQPACSRVAFWPVGVSGAVASSRG